MEYVGEGLYDRVKEVFDVNYGCVDGLMEMISIVDIGMVVFLFFDVKWEELIDIEMELGFLDSE